MTINKLSQRLLAEGYTKDQIPFEGLREWQDFYGGWHYKASALWSMVFETPCGLLVNGNHFTSGHMSFMGVEWTVENDCPTVTCPRFSHEPCPLNHELLRDNAVNNMREPLYSCACRRVEKPYVYEGSFEQAHDNNWKEADRLWVEYFHKLNGRACREHSNYNRCTKKWEMHYNPMTCARSRMSCKFCNVLQEELSPKMGNVYYDLKRSWTVPGIGLFPDEQKTTVTKGIRLLDHPVSVTICEAVIRFSIEEITDSFMGNKHWEMYFDPSLSYELVNFRCERRPVRDLRQDLADIAAGIEVKHNSDLKKEKAQAKRERSAKYRDAKIKRMIREANGPECQRQWYVRKKLDEWGIDYSAAEKQIDLARHLGVSQGAMSNYERGVHDPPKILLFRIADRYGVSLDYLMEYTDTRVLPTSPTKLLLKEYLTERYEKTISDELVTTIDEIMDSLMKLHCIHGR